MSANTSADPISAVAGAIGDIAGAIGDVLTAVANQVSTAINFQNTKIAASSQAADNYINATTLQQKLLYIVAIVFVIAIFYYALKTKK